MNPKFSELVTERMLPPLKSKLELLVQDKALLFYQESWESDFRRTCHRSSVKLFSRKSEKLRAGLIAFFHQHLFLTPAVFPDYLPHHWACVECLCSKLFLLPRSQHDCD